MTSKNVLVFVTIWLVQVCRVENYYQQYRYPYQVPSYQYGYQQNPVMSGYSAPQAEQMVQPNIYPYMPSYQMPMAYQQQMTVPQQLASQQEYGGSVTNQEVQYAAQQPVSPFGYYNQNPYIMNPYPYGYYPYQYSSQYNQPINPYNYIQQPAQLNYASPIQQNAEHVYEEYDENGNLISTRNEKQLLTPEQLIEMYNNVSVETKDGSSSSPYVYEQPISATFSQQSASKPQDIKRVTNTVKNTTTTIITHTLVRPNQKPETIVRVYRDPSEGGQNTTVVNPDNNEFKIETGVSEVVHIGPEDTVTMTDEVIEPDDSEMVVEPTEVIVPMIEMIVHPPETNVSVPVDDNKTDNDVDDEDTGDDDDDDEDEDDNDDDEFSEKEDEEDEDNDDQLKEDTSVITATTERVSTTTAKHGWTIFG